MSTLLIIDGYSLAFRAFYAYPLTLTQNNGSPINMVYGFITLLFRAIDVFKPSHLIVCFDHPDPSFRKKLYSQYKANRSETPPEFIAQVTTLKNILNKFDIYFFDFAGFEADDLIGSLSETFYTNFEEILIYSGDHDTFQLVNQKVNVIMPAKGASEYIIIDENAVQKKYGIRPNQIVDFKALKGDASDNIPGALGIGEKTATKLLSEFQLLNNIYNELDSLGNEKLKQKLLASKNNVFLSQKLAKIKCDIQVDLDPAKFRCCLNWECIQKTFEDYQFRSLLTKYNTFFKPTNIQITSNETLANYILCDDLNKLKSLIKHLHSGFAFDCETTSLDTQCAQIVGISFSFKKGEAFYIPFNDYLESASELQEVCLFETTNAKPILFKSNPFLEQLKGIFQDENIMKYTHNGKYDAQVLSQYGIDVKGLYFDTMIASFLLFPLEKVSLKECAARHLDMQLTSYEELVGKGAKQMLFSECSLGDAMNYACSDADATYQLMEFFKPLLKKQKLDRLFFNIEMPLQYVLQKMEMQGVSVDLEALSELKLKFEKRVSQIQKEIFSMIGKVINLNSSQQLSIVLYDDLNLPVIKKTKTGRSTDNSVLEELKNEHDIIKLIIEYRSLEKLLTTYIYSLGQLKSPKTNKIHTSFNQTIAITGRLTSSRPNLQNIPIRSQNGMEIRKAFTASTKEHLLMSADYSQIELRIMAHLSQDPAMVQFFLNNEDIHQSTAASIFNIECNEVSKQQRYFAKSINFGIIYGMSAKALSRQLQISKDDAQQFIDTYFERFTGVKKFIDHTIESARKAQGVSTEFDRFRPLPSINAPNWSIRKFNERAAVNTVLQGTAADLIKLAMIHIQREIESLSLRSRMVIQVHDELVFDVPQDEFVKLKEIVVRTMSSVKSYRVPLVVDVESGYSWCYA